MNPNNQNSLSQKQMEDTFAGFQEQLQNILETDFHRDESLLRGCLQLVHSKTSKFLQSALLERHSSDRSLVASSDAPLVLDLVWKNVHYPFFKFFQGWKSRNTVEGGKPNYGGHRQMNSTLQKLFPQIHKLYYSTIEMLFANYNMDLLIPSDTRSKLNISFKKFSDDSMTKLSPDDQFSIDCVLTLQRCLLYISSCHRYKVVMEHISDKYQQSDFQKSLRYLDIASNLVPSVGETYLQRGICFTLTKNFGNAAYQFVRSALSRIPSDAGLPNFKSLLGDPNGSLFKKLLASLDDLKIQETIKKRIINMEIMEFYILPIIGFHIFPETWGNNRHSERLRHFQTLLFDKIEIRYIKNISMIVQDLILVIGGFHIHQLINLPCATDKKNSNLTQSELKFLEFIFKFFTHLLEKVIIKEYKNSEMFQYLAMVRIMICWIKSNKSVLKFAHRCTPFCNSLAVLTNEVLSANEWAEEFNDLHRPTREFFFEEDIILKEFSPIRFSLSDFNDEEMLNMENLPDRLSGKLNRTSLPIADHSLRIKAIIYSNKRFLEKNACGFKWDETKEKYIQSSNQKRTKGTLPTSYAKTSNAKPQDYNVKGNRAQTKGHLNNMAIARRENSNGSGASLVDSSPSPHFKDDLNNGIHSTGVWGYSGSTLPSAPLSFDAIPSFSMPGSTEGNEVSNPFAVYNKNELSSKSNSNGSISPAFPSVSSQNTYVQLPTTLPDKNKFDYNDTQMNSVTGLPKLNVQNLSTFNKYMLESPHESQVSIFARDNSLMSSQMSSSSGLYEQAQQRPYMGSQYAQFENPISSISNDFPATQPGAAQQQVPANFRRDSQFFPSQGGFGGDQLPSMPQKVTEQYNFFFY